MAAPHPASFGSADKARVAVESISRECKLKRAVFVRRRRRFEDPLTGGVLSGVRSRLKRAFFPHSIALTTARSSSNAAVGTLVDKQLSRYARTGKLTSKRVTKKRGRPKKPHQFSRQVVARLMEENLTAVASQVPVRIGGCATALDLVCWDKTDGALVQVEIKTGMDVGSRSKKAGVLAEPFCHMPNASLSHAYLQASWAQEAARESSLPIARSFVLVANSTKACRVSKGRWHPLPPDLGSKEATAAIRAGVSNATGRAIHPPLPIQTGRLPWET
jgi:hypothetical protein